MGTFLKTKFFGHGKVLGFDSAMILLGIGAVGLAGLILVPANACRILFTADQADAAREVIRAARVKALELKPRQKLKPSQKEGETIVTPNSWLIQHLSPLAAHQPEGYKEIVHKLVTTDLNDEQAFEEIVEMYVGIMKFYWDNFPENPWTYARFSQVLGMVPLSVSLCLLPPT